MKNYISFCYINPFFYPSHPTQVRLQVSLKKHCLDCRCTCMILDMYSYPMVYFLLQVVEALTMCVIFQVSFVCCKFFFSECKRITVKRITFSRMFSKFLACLRKSLCITYLLGQYLHKLHHVKYLTWDLKHMYMKQQLKALGLQQAIEESVDWPLLSWLRDVSDSRISVEVISLYKTYQQIFNRKSISRNPTHDQFWILIQIQCS